MRILALLLSIHSLAFGTNSNPCPCKPYTSQQEIDCDSYLSDTELEWLPSGYARAAKCACQLSGLKGADSDSARCVREFVHNAHQSSSYFSESDKFALANAHGNALQQYRAIRSTRFSYKAHQLHQDAYEACCCTHQPANQWTWDIVSIIGLPTEKLCDFEIHEIEEHGSCGCDGW